MFLSLLFAVQRWPANRIGTRSMRPGRLLAAQTHRSPDDRCTHLFTFVVIAALSRHSRSYACILQFRLHDVLLDFGCVEEICNTNVCVGRKRPLDPPHPKSMEIHGIS